MAFYQSLSSYYDKIFPLNDVAFTFITKHFTKEHKLLDIGAGTGNLAIALHEKGFYVTASEPDLAMMDMIKRKNHSKGLVVESRSMEQLAQFEGNFDGIICVGNTLPHLQSYEQIEKFLLNCYAKLNDHGKLILQLVNYEYVLTADHFSFPVIKKEDFTFTRQYTMTTDQVMFTSTLTTADETIENTIPLTPITSTKLIPMIKKAGFQQIDCYGNFKGEPYNEQSNAFICVARK